MIQFRVAGFPVEVRWSFFAVVALIGVGPSIDATRLAIWVGVVFASVMIHELGHATAARRLGAAPEIELYGMGGLTRWGGIEPSRWQMIGVTLAGPGAGFLVGAVVGGLVLALGTSGTGDVRFFALTVLWVNIGWGIVNLLPVLPLDGGHVIAELFPGERPVRYQRAAIASIVVAVIGGIAVFLSGWIFGLVLCGWALMTNLGVLRTHRANQRATDAAERIPSILQRVAHRDADVTADAVAVIAALGTDNVLPRLALIETAAAAGDAATARAMLDAPGASLPPAAYALTFATESAGAQGVDELVAILHREPNEPHARWLTIALLGAGRLAELPAHAAAVPPAIGDVMARTAEQLGRRDDAAAVRVALSGAVPPGTHREPPSPSPPDPEPPSRR